MPDRRRRTAFRLPSPARAALLMRERQSSSPDSAPGTPDSSGGSPSASGSPASGSPSGSTDSAAPDAPAKPADDNPFAPPPADRPDQPWQPRHPSGSEDGDEGSGGRPSWGSQWSDKQPGRGGGGFGGRSGSNGPGGKGGPDGGPGGMRWDPTDPVQRRARYALLGGIWAIFFALFDFPEIALLLGALSVYWSISSLRAQPKSPSTSDRTAVGAAPGAGASATGDGGASPSAAPAQTGDRRPQTTAAISGLVTALLALIIVITTYTVQLVYRDYYTCVNDALTKTGAVACNDQLPKPLEPLFGVKD
ncbi:hypothetical protein ACFY9Q_17940 [Streptomyces sp. NPDC012389]|uniref:hypothetical protein n=1 Tax=Streptomyces sp. NPDC012389 TaxID=3364830 RepID=UPI0036ECD4A8